MPSNPPAPRRSTARTILMLPKEPVRIEVLPSAALTPAQLDGVWSVTTRYVDTARPDFERKLGELPEIALFRTAGGEVVGVTSFDVYRVRRAGRPRTVIFTSSVVVDERYRRQNLPLRLGVRLFIRTKLRRPLEPVDWLFDTFSYRSYVLLPRNFAEYWPRRDRATPAGAAAYMDQLARDRYGDAWRPALGVVGRSGGKRLRPETAPVDDRLLAADADVRFFDTVNAGHREGDMLVCLCPLTVQNWAHALGSVARRQRDVRARGRSIRRHSASVRRPSLTTNRPA